MHATYMAKYMTTLQNSSGSYTPPTNPTFSPKINFNKQFCTDTTRRSKDEMFEDVTHGTKTKDEESSKND